MDDLLREAAEALQSGGDQTQVLGVWEVLFALALSLACSTVVALVYRYTHRSIGYSQSYVQTLVLTSLVTTLIMIVIGSNIARAFSLVGALSIIRYRNAIKETRDVGYIFFAMAIAMASGTRFYGVAIMATILISLVMLTFHFTNFGTSKQDPERLLRIQLPAGVDAESVLEPVLRELFRSFSVVLVESARHGLQTEILYSVRPRKEVSPSKIIEEISKVNDGLKVSYNYSAHTDGL